MDFTIKSDNKVIVRFNDYIVMELNLSMSDLSISGTVTDETEDAVYIITGSIQPGE